MTNIQPIEEVVEEYDKKFVDVGAWRVGKHVHSDDIPTIKSWLRKTLQTRDQAWESRVEEVKKEERKVFAKILNDLLSIQVHKLPKLITELRDNLQFITPTSNTKEK